MMARGAARDGAGAAGAPPRAPSADERGSPAQASAIRVSDRQHLLSVAPDDVRSLVRFTLAQEGRDGAVDVAFVDDAVMADLHVRFLGVAGPTDVMTFPCPPEPLAGDGGELGEIVISTETAIRQASDGCGDALDECLLYVVHGVLHLVGYDDRDDGSAATMAARQDEVLARWRERGRRDRS